MTGSWVAADDASMTSDSTSPVSPEPAQPGPRRYTYAERVLHAFLVDGRLTGHPGP